MATETCDTTLQTIAPPSGAGDASWYGSENWSPAAQVDTHLEFLGKAAVTSFTNTVEFLKCLRDTILNDLQVDAAGYLVDFDDIEFTGSSFSLPSVPTAPSISIQLPTLPAEFVPGTISPLTVTNPPEFTEDAPVVQEIPTPDATLPDFNSTLPDVDYDAGVFPTILPDTTLPTVPTFEELQLPAVPDISLPEFVAVVPDATDISVPGNVFLYNEDPYSSELLTSVTAELIDRVVNGGTGLNPSVEDAIWNRGRDREQINSRSTRETLIAEEASKGWQLPNGAVLNKLQRADQEAQNAISTLSRDIMIKQAELEQENVKFAIQQSIALEQVLIDHFNKVQDRALKASMYVQDTAIQLYNAEVAKFNTEVEIYKAYAQAFESRVRAELTTVEIYKAQVDAEKTRGEVNEQLVRLYIAQVDGIKSSVDIYKAQVEAAVERLAAEKIKVDVFNGEVTAFANIVDAKKAEFEMYSEQVKAEMAKVEIYDTKVKAFATRIDAYAKEVDADSKVIDIEIEKEKLRLQSYLSQLEAAIKRAQIESAYVGAEVDLFKGEVQAYTSQVSAEGTRVDAENRIFLSQIERERARTAVALKNAEIALANAQRVTELVGDAAKAGAQVSAQLAASAFAAINVSAQIQGSSSDVESHNYNYTM